MNPRPYYNIALVGTGSAAFSHANAIIQASSVRLSAIVSSSEQRAEQLAKRLGISGNCKIFNDYSKVVQEESIDIIDIANENYLHGKMGILAAQAGKHVLVEKPIDVDLHQANELLEVCKRHKKQLSVIAPYRFKRSITALKNAIDKGLLGNIISCNASLNWRREKDYYVRRPWRASWDRCGGGVLINQGIHILDLLLWLLGPAKRVWGFVVTRCLPIEVEDTGFAVIEFLNGSMALFEASVCHLRNSCFVLDTIGERGRIRVEENKITHWDVGERRRDVMRFYSWIKSLKKYKDGGLASQIEDFVQSIRCGHSPMVTGIDGVNALRVVLAIYRSSRDGKAISLD